MGVPFYRKDIVAAICEKENLDTDALIRIKLYNNKLSIGEMYIDENMGKGVVIQIKKEAKSSHWLDQFEVNPKNMTYITFDGNGFMRKKEIGDESEYVNNTQSPKEFQELMEKVNLCREKYYKKIVEKTANLTMVRKEKRDSIMEIHDENLASDPVVSKIIQNKNYKQLETEEAKKRMGRLRQNTNADERVTRLKKEIDRLDERIEKIKRDIIGNDKECMGKI